MNRPLLITDCDEVLLHMVVHFGAWLGEVHDVLEGVYAKAHARRDAGHVVREGAAHPATVEADREAALLRVVHVLGEVGAQTRGRL